MQRVAQDLLVIQLSYYTGTTVGSALSEHERYPTRQCPSRRSDSSGVRAQRSERVAQEVLVIAKAWLSPWSSVRATGPVGFGPFGPWARAPVP